MDMCNGEILSYGIDKKPSAKNVMGALGKAIEITSDCPYRRTFHSDQGWAYQMKAYSHREYSCAISSHKNIQFRYIG